MGIQERTLASEPYEYRQQQYFEKNEILQQFGEQVSATTLYEDIYDDLDTIIPVVVLESGNRSHIQRMSVDSAITEASSHHRNDLFVSCLKFYHAYIRKETAGDLLALVVDMDNVYSGSLLYALQNDWATANGKKVPLPTYIVNSGSGLHLIFVLDRPLPCFYRNRDALNRLNHALTVAETSERVYVRSDEHWYGQHYRIAGGYGKDLFENTAFRVGDRWNPYALAKACGIEDDLKFYYERPLRSTPTKNRPKVAEVKKPEPEINIDTIKSKKKKYGKGYRTNRGFYDYTLQNCRVKTREGHRYLSMCALTIIAYKCDVEQSQLAEDLRNLLPVYNRSCINKIDEKEIDSALTMYNPKATKTPKKTLESWLGWEFQKNKRNGLKRNDHLEICRTVKQVKKKLGILKKDGRPSVENDVRSWFSEHPEGTIAECAKATDLSRSVVYKWRSKMKSEECL